MLRVRTPDSAGSGKVKAGRLGGQDQCAVMVNDGDSSP